MPIKSQQNIEYNRDIQKKTKSLMTIKKPADKKVSHSREDISETLGSRFLQLSIPSHATYLLQALNLKTLHNGKSNLS